MKSFTLRESHEHFFFFLVQDYKRLLIHIVKVWSALRHDSWTKLDECLKSCVLNNMVYFIGWKMGMKIL